MKKVNAQSLRLLLLASLTAFGLLTAGVASATSIVMNFDQLNPNGELVYQYYDGGCGGSWQESTPTCNGPNDGVVWFGEPVAGSATYYTAIGEPSASNMLGILGPGAGMNVASGFTGLGFYYSFNQNGGAVNVYSGLNETGSRLTTQNLSPTGSGCGRNLGPSCWLFVNVPFVGTAKSVIFFGTYALLDNVTLDFGAPQSIPEPAALGMFGLGLLLIGGFIGLRERGGRRSNKEALP